MNLFNMKISLKLIVVFLLLLGWNSILRAEILVYPVPQGIYYARHNDDYTVKVRQCAAIVKAHGGEIQAESKVGEGTSIRFWLETESIETEENEDEQ